MNRSALCIKLLLKLYSVERIDRVELAKYLECNERNVREYISELRTAGYNITSSRGFNGGYSLNKTEFFPVLRLTKEEILSLEKGLIYLQNKSDFIGKNEFAEAISKVVATTRSNNPEFDSIKIIEKYPLAMGAVELKERHSLITQAIKNNKKIKVKYQAVSSNGYKEYILHPYNCIIFNNYWYVIAWNENITDIDPIGIYKLNRFLEIMALEEDFSVISTYDENKYIDNFSFKMGERIRVKIMFKNVNIAIKERIYGIKQELTEIDENTIILDCYMNKFDATTLVLSFGSNAKVLEPKELASEVKKNLQRTLQQYE